MYRNSAGAREEVMAYFPLYIDLEQKECIVIGGGRVAEGKVRQLRSFGARVCVISPEVTAPLQKMAERGEIHWLCARFPIGEEWKKMLADSTLVVAATNHNDVNRQVSESCRQAGVPVNVVDVKELCTFFFPAIVRQGDVVVGISTSGQSPALAARIRRELEPVIPEEYGRAAELLGACREEILARVPDGAERKKLFEAMLAELLGDDAIPEHRAAGRAAGGCDRLENNKNNGEESGR